MTYIYSQSKSWPYAGLPSSTIVQVMPTCRSQVQECEVTNLHANSKWCTCSMRITTSSVTVLLYKEKEYKQVIKTFSKNVEGYRDGSAKNH